MTPIRFTRVVLAFAGAAFLLVPPALMPASAQTAGGNPGYFMPPTAQTAAPRGMPRAAPRERAVRAAEPQAPSDLVGGGAPGGEALAGPVRAQLPPAPAIPDVPRAAMPPAAVIGVLSIPDVLRASTAYREAEKTMAERGQRMNQDAQKETQVLRGLGQTLETETAKMTPAQVQANPQLLNKERALQARITESRRKFSDRARILRDSSQYALAQIQRTLTDVVARVASARGMNLVLQRAEVALNQGEFDITAQVADVLNKALPRVVIPPDGVSPAAIASASPAEHATTTAAETPRKSHSAQHH